MKKLGFEFEEVMSGTYTRAGHPDETGAIKLRGRARAQGLIRHLRDGLTTLQGTLDMEGFADEVPISGTLELRPLLGRLIRYDLAFTGNDGAPYRFRGQKDIRWDALRASLTTLPASITDANGNEVAQATLRFDLADLVPFVVSWKPALS